MNARGLSIRGHSKCRQKMYAALWDQLAEELNVSRGRSFSGAPPTTSVVPGGPAPAGADASDIYSMEAATLEHLSTQELRLRIIAFRGMLANLLTPESYTALSAQFSRDLANRQSLLDEAHGLLSRLYRRYVLVPAVEDLKANIAASMTISVSLVALAILVIAIFQAGQTRGYIFVDGFVLAAMAGAIGATVSTLVRLNNVDPRHEPLLTWLNLERGRPSLWATPLLGAVFGLVFLLLVRAGLLSGSIFPEFSELGWKNMQPLLSECSGAICKAIYTDLAKLLILGFLAGWAERMVPDVLSRLSSQPVGFLREEIPTTGSGMPPWQGSEEPQAGKEGLPPVQHKSDGEKGEAEITARAPDEAEGADSAKP